MGKHVVDGLVEELMVGRETLSILQSEYCNFLPSMDFPVPLLKPNIDHYCSNSNSKNFYKKYKPQELEPYTS